MGNTQSSSTFFFRDRPSFNPKSFASKSVVEGSDASIGKEDTTREDEHIQLNAIRENLRGVPEEWIRQIQASVSLRDEKLSVNLAKRQLEKVPAWLEVNKHSDRVTEIDLSVNRLRDFPAVIGKFRNLERLGLGSNEIGLVPDEIGKLKNLIWFDFTHNRIAHVSDRIAELPKLVSLGASDCRLTSFPLAFTKVARLRKLGMFNNLISSLPPEIGRLTLLTKLDLSGNNLSTLPPEIGNLTNLAWLNVSNNRLSLLPKELDKLVALKELGLAHNRLTTLPNLGNLKSLTLLTAFNNQLEEVGDWIVELSGLIKLDLSSNHLTFLPSNILTLPNLQLLNVRGNQLAELCPPNPRNHYQRSKTLQILDLRDNQIVSLCFGNLGPSTIMINGNPLLAESIHSQYSIPSLALLATAMAINANFLPTTRHVLLTSNNLPSHLHLQICEAWEGKIGYTCQYCLQQFLHCPLRVVDEIQSSDDTTIPCIAQLCGPSCRDSFLKGTFGTRRRSSDHATTSPRMESIR